MVKLLNPFYIWERRSRVVPRMQRIVSNPFLRRGIPFGRNAKLLKSYENIHAGKRAFIIGNGPSLRIADLDCLKNEITFASNKVFLAYESTAWRPTYYFVFDHLVGINNRDKIKQLPGPKFFDSLLQPVLGEVNEAAWIEPVNHSLFRDSKGPPGILESNEVFSKNLLFGAGSAGTVIYAQLQVAFYMGITEAILIGVDFSFTLSQTTTTKVAGYEKALKSSGEVNHFHPDYRKPGEIWAVPNMQYQTRGFSFAREVYERAGRKVINASRRTELTVFPRENFDDLFPPQVSSVEPRAAGQA